MDSVILSEVLCAKCRHSAQRIALALAFGFAAICPTSAAEPSVPVPGSLKFIPDDAACYGTVFRLREQFDVIAGSRAMAKLRGLPLVQEFVARLVEGPSMAQGANPVTNHVGPGVPTDGVPLPADETDADATDEPETSADCFIMQPAGFDLEVILKPLRAFCRDDANAELLKFIAAALSDEAFISVDGNAVEFVDRLGTISQGLAENEADQAAQFDLAAHLAELPIPSLIVGFKLPNRDLALPHLARVERWLREFLEESPEFPAKLSQQRIGSNTFLSLKFEGARIPWEKWLEESNEPEAGALDESAPKVDDTDDDESVDPKEEGSQAPDPVRAEKRRKIVEKLKSRSLTISLGAYDDYLLVAVGEKNSLLLKLREGSKRLADRAELAPVVRASEKPLTSVGYISPELSRSLVENSQKFWPLAKLVISIVQALLTNDEPGPIFVFGPRSPDQLELFLEWQSKLAAIAKPRADSGAVSCWTLRTPNGYEGFSYRWHDKSQPAGNSQPLTVLDHVGGDPLIVVASRARDTDEQLQSLFRWTTLVETIFDAWSRQLGFLSFWEEELDQLREEFVPLRERLSLITRTKLMPALGDRQTAFVLDAKIARRKWGDSLPESAQPLPLPAPALVCGVKDARLLGDAFDDYLKFVQDTADLLHDRYSDLFPKLQLKKLARQESSGVTWYEFPRGGEDKNSNEAALNVAVRSDIAVVSLFPAQSKRLLARTPLQLATFRKQRDQPLSAAWHVNFAGLVDVVAPWAEYLIDTPVAGPAAADGMTDAAQIQAILDVLKCWRGASGMTYVDGPATVDFFEATFDDLK